MRHTEIASLTRLPRPAEGEDVSAVLRRHLAILLGPVLLVLCAFVASLVVSNTLQRSEWVPFCWIAFGILVIRLLWRIYCWLTEYYMVTPERIKRVYGTLRRKEDSLPLSRVTDIRLDQSLLGRMLGFGNLVFESVCFDRFIWRFDCAPYPQHLLQELRESTFPDQYLRGIPFARKAILGQLHQAGHRPDDRADEDEA